MQVAVPLLPSPRVAFRPSVLAQAPWRGPWERVLWCFPFGVVAVTGIDAGFVHGPEWGPDNCSVPQALLSPRYGTVAAETPYENSIKMCNVP